ncbi:rhamnulokinase [Salinibacillus kushneri]|uniref:Rhamnulokinase n=1 Tax=Salinibacillus kushneri TaxID=237682 RepID=A0A1H9Z169_9BACI|nr:rhamnulokinase family protein [Salinibacillus kushneri]SES75250.1 rhamnulokinase [Salinibacillus kushneri]
MKKVWAFDLGASNGRLMLSKFSGDHLEIEEVHRFKNEPVFLTSHYYWDILKIFDEMKTGILKSVKQGHGDISSVAVDTWGVDFGLLTKQGEILGNPFSYRDSQTFRGINLVLQKLSANEWFGISGVEPAPINTICQLAAIQERNPELLEQANSLLLTPNLVSYLFSGVKANEFTISTTTSMLNIEQRTWDEELLDTFQIPKGIMAPVVEPGTVLGPTLESINQELNINPVPVIAGAGHDTACALAALPLKDDHSAFMSCGTWILLGVQVKEPVITKQSLEWGFTNEGTMDGDYRLLKNSMGLWLIQQCKKVWEKEGSGISYTEEAAFVKEAKPFQSFINPDLDVFLNPIDMVKKIQNVCQETHQSVPETKGEILRVILESLALKYRWVIERMEQLTGKRIHVINMGGGGIQNEWLCQFTANATQRQVVAGPIEVSSIGNSIGQLLALGEINNLAEARSLVASSFTTTTYEPENPGEWQQAYERFTDLIKQGRNHL